MGPILTVELFVLRNGWWVISNSSLTQIPTEMRVFRRGTMARFTMWPQNSAWLILAASNIIKLISEPGIRFG